MNPFTRDAPAKINLYLRVLGKRDDGYHQVKTLMIKLPGLADQLTFTESEEFAFTCSDPAVPSDETNLVVKAVRAFEAKTMLASKFAIHLEKIVPHGAGLGGGSSDAATTLLALNEIHGEPLGKSQLSTIAASLGSDIPFFLFPGAALCTGRGEIVNPADSPPPLHLLLLKPSFGVSTQDAYGRFGNSQGIPGISYRNQRLDWGTISNNLERPVFQKHRFLAELKHWLLARNEVKAALMSGSGSTVFAIIKKPVDAEKLANEARTALDPTLWSWSGFTE
jgi:4-diphosphocytidyl-2-C-methyl-D-erythritol kinase